MIKKVLILGQHGQLAQQLVATCPSHLQYVCVGRRQHLEQIFAEFNPDCVINTAAYTAVDAAEFDRDAALAVNLGLVQRLQRLCMRSDLPLIQLSTDFVFSGDKGCAYHEQDQIGAINYYGKTKALAERFLLEHYAAQSIIIRTSWLYSCYGDNFVIKVLKSLTSNSSDRLLMPVQQGSPTWALGLAQVLWLIVQNSELRGLYHWADIGSASRAEFTRAIIEFAFELGLTKNRIPVETLPYQVTKGLAKRPSNSTLDSSLLRAELATETAEDWKSQLKQMLVHYKATKER